MLWWAGRSIVKDVQALATLAQAADSAAAPAETQVACRYCAGISWALYQTYCAHLVH